MDPQTFKTASTAVYNSFMTCVMLSCANKDCYGSLKAKLENAQLLRRDDFLKTREELMGILNNFKDETKTTEYDKSSAPWQVAFYENREVVGQANPAAAPAAAASGVKMNAAGKSTCHECGAKDHWSYELPRHTSDKQARLKTIYDRRHPPVDGILAAQVGEMVGVDDILQAPPNGIAQDRIDGMAESARAEDTSGAGDTSPPSPLLGVSLLASNRPGRRMALDPDRAYLDNCATFDQAMNPDILKTSLSPRKPFLLTATPVQRRPTLRVCWGHSSAGSTKMVLRTSSAYRSLLGSATPSHRTTV